MLKVNTALRKLNIKMLKYKD